MQSTFDNRMTRAIKTLAIPAMAIGIATGAAAQGSTTAIKKDTPVAVSAKDMKTQPATMHAVRASKFIGMKVKGGQGKDVGEIKDLIVNVNTGDVRYALLEFDPGFFKSEKLFAVPLKELSMDSEKDTLRYADTSRKQMEKAGVDKADWKKAVDNRRYVEGLDQNYGFKPVAGTSRSFRASELIGKDVNSRAGKDIGDVKELVIDLGAAKISYAVLAFDPSWTTGEKLYAFPLTAFKLEKDKDDLMLDVDKAMLASMKAFDANKWSNLNDLKHDDFVNPAPMVKK